MTQHSNKESELNIYFPKEGISQSSFVTIEGDGLYRLLEHPFLVEGVKYGDVVRGQLRDDGTLEFIEVVTPSPLKLYSPILILPEKISSSPKLKAILARVEQTGGYWQLDWGGCLSVLFDPHQYNPTEALGKL